MNVKNPQLIKLPRDVQFSLYLIREELKSRKLFHALGEIGVTDCNFQPCLDILILESMGIEKRSDETLSVCYDILERRSKKIEVDAESIMKQTLKVYWELRNLSRDEK